MSSHEWRQNPLTLTDRERTILELIADGFSNEEIAAGLALSRNTVKWYIQLIYQKLGVSRRTQAVGQARTLGLLGGLTVSDPPSRSHLPTPAAPLIGRETDLAALSELLNRADVRLLSIVGPSGMGKTRLALAVAAEWQRQVVGALVSLEKSHPEELLPPSPKR
jgi:ATP/maltotriose-dependent transcriptional regulator MalT